MKSIKDVYEVDMKVRFLCSILFVYSVFFAPSVAAQEEFSTGGTVTIERRASKEDPKLNRSRGIRMLKDLKAAIEENYYDRSFRGMDLDAKFDEAMERVKTLDKNWQINRVIAGLIMEFNDSHTQFYPPGRANAVEYGFGLQMIGDQCFVVSVKKGSDAEKNGIRPGHLVRKIEGYVPTRRDLWKIEYLIYDLDPREKLRLEIQEGESQKEYLVSAKFKSIKEQEQEARARRKKKADDPYKCVSVTPEIAACRLETFSVEVKHIERMMETAAKHNKLVLDLRGNGGGFVKMNEYLTGHFFDREVAIGEMIFRSKTRKIKAKPVRKNQFKGELIVLIDSDSASASEVFARVVQIEKRGKVVGDVSAGAVMTSWQMEMTEERGAPGFEVYTVYGMNLTVADLVMSDGGRLEGSGVIPEVLIGPSPKAIGQRSDPVLAYAILTFGHEIDEAKAGEFGFIRTKEENEEKEDSGETK